MIVEMQMPDLSTADSEVEVVRWLVEVGQPVRRGEPIMEVETDKATMEVESFVTGVLKDVSAGPGDKVEAGQMIARIDAEGPVATVPAGPQAAGKKGGMFERNRRAATDRSVVSPSAVSLTPVQRTVARRMQQSKQTAPHFYLVTSADAERMIARREGSGPEKIVWDAFFVYATGRTLKRFERMAARIENDRLVPSGTDAIGVAVDLDGDLYAIPITAPDGKSPEQISREIRQAVEHLRSGHSSFKSPRPANMTITNLGSCNVETFTAIINPPESAVLAIGKIAPAAAVVDGMINIRNRVSLTLSVDHRVVSGKYAGDFLGAIVEELESL